MSANGRHVGNPDDRAVDRRDPGDAFLAEETESNRKGEFRLLGVTVIAGAFVAVLLVVREVFFA